MNQETPDVTEQQQGWHDKMDGWLRPKISKDTFLRLFPRNQVDFSSSPIPAYVSSLLATSIAVKNAMAKPAPFVPDQAPLHMSFDPKVAPKTPQEHLQRMQYEVQRLQQQKRALPAPLPYVFYGMVFGVCGTILQGGDWNNGASTTTGTLLVDLAPSRLGRGFG